MINKELFNYLEILGIKQDDTLLVHSSFSSLGEKDIKAFDFLKSIKSYLEKGTLILPSLSYEHVTKDNPCFDLRKTKSCNGYLSEVFRLGFDVVRSVHPTHSVCALGKEATSITHCHIEDSTPCGKNSPFALLPQVKGKILMIGCGLKPNTSMHAIEELFKPNYLFGEELNYTIIGRNGKWYDKKYITHDFKGYIQCYDRIITTNNSNWIVESNIYEAKCHLLNSETLWELAKAKIRSNPLYFVDKAKNKKITTTNNDSSEKH